MVFHRPIQRHDQCYRAVDLLRGLFLIQLQIAGRIGAHIGVIEIPAQYGVPAMIEPVLQHNAHHFFRRGRHVAEALS